MQYIMYVKNSNTIVVIVGYEYYQKHIRTIGYGSLQTMMVIKHICLYKYPIANQSGAIHRLLFHFHIYAT